MIWRWRGDLAPLLSAIAQAASSLALPYLCESLRTERQALKPCSSYCTLWKMRSMTAEHESPILDAQDLIRAASQSGYDRPAGMSAPLVAYLFVA